MEREHSSRITADRNITQSGNPAPNRTPSNSSNGLAAQFEAISQKNKEIESYLLEAKKLGFQFSRQPNHSNLLSQVASRAPEVNSSSLQTSSLVRASIDPQALKRYQPG